MNSDITTSEHQNTEHPGFYLNTELIKNTEPYVNDICIYVHVNPEAQEIFYVGLGSIDRPYNRKGRSDEWYEYVQSIYFNYNVIVLYKDLTYTEAAVLEKNLIKQIGRKDEGLGTLLNKTDGGEGNSTGSLYVLQQKMDILEQYVEKLQSIENDLLQKVFNCLTPIDFKTNHKEDYDLAVKLGILDKLYKYKEDVERNDALEKLKKEADIQVQKLKEANYFAERILTIAKIERTRQANLYLKDAEFREVIKETEEEKLEMLEFKIREQNNVKLFDDDELEDIDVLNSNFEQREVITDVNRINEILKKAQNYIAEFEEITGLVLEENTPF